MLRPVRLRCEYLVQPLGVHERAPRLFWELEGDGARQVAYRVTVGTAPRKSDLWDSGRVESGEHSHVEYGGAALASLQRCFWSVTVWDDMGGQAASKPGAFWEMGLLRHGDWSAKWIGLAPDIVDVPSPCAHLRRVFQLDALPKGARLALSALGLVEARINGRTVGADRLSPGWTDYGRRRHYRVYDVSELLHEGENVLGLVVADGWYCGSLSWFGRNQYGAFPVALAELRFGDEKIVTDSAWQGAYGPVMKADLLMGEEYDARSELGAWDQPGFQASGWRPVAALPLGPAPLVGAPHAAVQAIEELRPRAMTEPRKGIYVFDFGQNLTGWVKLRVNGPAGRRIELQFGEMLNPDGGLYSENLRTATQTDHYTTKGGGDEVWEPRFTIHGFRYAQVSGWPAALDLEALTAVVAHTRMEPTATFACSSPMVEQLVSNIRWGMRGNFIEVPTDCPQRDERLGWMGDAQAFVRTAAYLYDVAPIFTKWLADVRDAQAEDGMFPNVAPNMPGAGEGSPAWSDAGVIVPWMIYRFYGDRRLLARSLPSMTRFVECVRDANPDLLWRNKVGSSFGDWLSVGAETPHDLIATAFFAHSARLVARSARALGQSEQEQAYERLFWHVRHAFQAAFLGTNGALRAPTQTALALALRFDLLPLALRQQAVDDLSRDIEERGNRLTTGFIGLPHLLPALSDGGRNDLAYALLLQREFPSWGFMIDQGATTIWERWDGWTPDKGFQDAGMNSFNHYAFGAVGEWLMGSVGGIELDPDVPAFERFLIRPRPAKGLKHATASFHSIRGRIESHWETADGWLHARFRVPPNSQAVAILPSSAQGSFKLPPGCAALEGAPNERRFLAPPGEHQASTRL